MLDLYNISGPGGRLTLKSDIASKKHPLLICSDLRLSNWKFEDWNYGNRPHACSGEVYALLYIRFTHIMSALSLLVVLLLLLLLILLLYNCMCYYDMYIKCIHVYICIYIYIYICTHTCMCIYIYIYTCM